MVAETKIVEGYAKVHSFQSFFFGYLIRRMPTIPIKCNFPTKKGETRATMSGLQKSGESPNGSKRLIFAIKKAYICIKKFVYKSSICTCISFE